MHRILHNVMAGAVACGLACGVVCGATHAGHTFAYADDAQQAQDPTLDQLQQQVQQTADAYNQSTQRVKEIQAKLEANTEKLTEMQHELPKLRTQAANSIKVMYRFSQSNASLIDLIFSAKDFNDFISIMQYLNKIQHKNNEAITKLTEVVNDIKQTQSDLEQEKSDSERAQSQAKDAFDQAIEVRKRAQAEFEARKKAEAEAAKQAEEQAKQAAQAQKQFTTEQGNKVAVETPSKPVADVSLTEPREAFVTKWTQRINNYLAGSPLAGTGKTFAEAAWDNGVDPRWSPAISNIESSKGAACFKPYNAWGWGNSSWQNWQSAIRAHVAGLAQGYGSAPTPSAARKYCPPNASFWYSTCLNEMSKI